MYKVFDKMWLFNNQFKCISTSENINLIVNFFFQGTNVLFEFFILREIKSNKDIIGEEINNQNLFFNNEKLV